MNTLSCIAPAPSPAALEVCETTCVNKALVEFLRPGNLGMTDAARLSEIFAALSDPTRLRLLDALARAEALCVCDICALLDLKQSNVSHQLRLLRALRLVRNERRGRNVFYSLDDDHVRSLLCQGLDHIREKGHEQ